MNRIMGRYLSVSVTLHLAALMLSGFVFVVDEGAQPPVRVTLLTPPSNENMEGRIEEAPPAREPEHDADAKILSDAARGAHSPLKGDKARAKETVTPQERIDPPRPARIRDHVEQEEKRPGKPTTDIAALPPSSSAIPENAETLSATAGKPGAMTARAVEDSHFIPSPSAREARGPQLASLPSPRDATPRAEAPRPEGEEKSRGLAPQHPAAKNGVIDMGDEAVASLATRSFAYFEYFKNVRRSIEDSWVYPEEALLEGWSGAVVVRFTIGRGGALEGVEVLTPTGKDALDTHAREAVRGAAPFAPLPEGMGKTRLHVVATFVYKSGFYAIR